MTATKVKTVELELLTESASNPRRRRDAKADAELLESVKAKGVLFPLVCRHLADGFEIVCGSRRFRAAKAAGLTEVPFEVRDLTDEEARELQLVENSQRADVHPLDEADSYDELVKTYRYDADRLAAKVGKPIAHVRARLQLLNLCDAGRKAWLGDELSEDAAVALARVPTVKAQTAVLKRVTERLAEDHRGEVEVVNAHAMRDAIRRLSTLTIASAHFDVEDATLVPKAGSCSTCPKRTGTQKTMFEDLTADDCCTDLECWREKNDAAWARTKTAAKTKGEAVLPKEEVKKLYPYGDHRTAYGGGYVDLDSEDSYPRYGKTVRSAFGKDLPPIVHAQRPDGVPVQLVSKKDYEKAVRAKAKAKQKATVDPGAAKAKDQAALRAAEHRGDAAGRERVIRAITQEVVLSGLAELDRVQAIARLAAEVAWGDADDAARKARGITDDQEAKVDPLEAWIETASIGECRALVVELLVRSGISRGDMDGLEEVADSFGVNAKAIVKEETKKAVEEHKAKVKAKPKGAAKAPAKKASKKKAATKAKAKAK